MTEEPVRVLLIRHASNDYLSSNRLAGRTPGVHLNERGRAEARAVAERLALTPLAGVYSSPLERAQETAEPIAHLHGLTVSALDGLAETDCGEWTGAALEELSQTELWGKIRSTPSCVRLPGGESMVEVQTRMVAVVESLRAVPPGRSVALVSHSDPIKLVLTYYVGLPLDMFQRLEISPASISELEFRSPWPRLVRSNDRSHLDSLGSETQ